MLGLGYESKVLDRRLKAGAANAFGKFAGKITIVMILMGLMIYAVAAIYDDETEYAEDKWLPQRTWLPRRQPATVFPPTPPPRKPRAFASDLSHTNIGVAAQIHTAIKSAELVRTDDFVPSGRTLAQIQASKNKFMGMFDGEILAVVAEVEQRGPRRVHIVSLDALPGQQPRFLASLLLQHILLIHANDDLTATTAVRNDWMLQFYLEHGFTRGERCTAKDGVEKIMLSHP